MATDIKPRNRNLRRDDIALERLQELLAYEPETGLFRWRVDKNRGRAGAVAGTILSPKRPYLIIGVDDRRFLAHRLAWFYMTGKWPESGIDHVNGEQSDNRWANLREATQSQNSGNGRAKSTNTSGFKGVFPKDGKWVASIMVDGDRIWLGRWNTAEDAAQVYRIAAKRFFGKFAKTTIRKEI
jgi:hypothetical protein